MSLYSICIYCYNFVQCIQRNVTSNMLLAIHEMVYKMTLPYVVITIAEKFTQNIYRHNAETIIGFNLKYSQNRLI